MSSRGCHLKERVIFVEKMQRNVWPTIDDDLDNPFCLCVGPFRAHKTSG